MNNILVLGSKQNSLLPDIKVKKIYSANAACEKADLYLKKYPDTSHTSIVGLKHFMHDQGVQKRVLNSKIDKFVTRGKGDINQFNFKSKIVQISLVKQFKMQSKMFKYGYLDLFLAELRYEEELFKKFYYLMKCLKQKSFLGVSTGFFAIIYALIENPDSEIIISGISMRQGSHFYPEATRNFTGRANVDNYLIKNISKKFRTRLQSLDIELYQTHKIKKWNGRKF